MGCFVNKALELREEENILVYDQTFSTNFDLVIFSSESYCALPVLNASGEYRTTVHETGISLICWIDLLEIPHLKLVVVLWCSSLNVRK